MSHPVLAESWLEEGLVNSDEEQQDSSRSGALRSRLAGIFGEEVDEGKHRSNNIEKNTKNVKGNSAEVIDKENEQGFNGLNGVGVLCSVVEGKFSPSGRIGISVLHVKNQLLFIVYTPSKQSVLNLPLDGQTSFTLGYSKRIIQIATNDTSLSLLLDDSKLELQLVPLLMLFCTGTTLVDLEEVSDSVDVVVVAVGWSLLMDETVWSCAQDRVMMKHLNSVKHRISNDSENWTSSLRGMHVGSHRILRRDDCVVVVKLRKAKRAGNKTADSEREQSSEVEERKERVSSPVETVADAEIEKPIGPETHDNDVETTQPLVLDRIARMGRSVLPTIGTTLAPKNVECSTSSQDDKDESCVTSAVIKEESTKARAAPSSRTSETAAHSPRCCPAEAEYSTLHRILGIEMDRLEIRLEASIQRMLERKFETLEEKIEMLAEQQQRLMELVTTRTQTEIKENMENEE